MREEALDPTLIGRRSTPSSVNIEGGQLKFYAKATDQRDPVYFDEAVACAAGHRAIPAPLTFAFTLILALPKQAGFALQLVKADPRYILHGEQKFDYREMLYAGDQVTIDTEIADLYEKKRGALRFVVQRTNVTNSAGVLCVVSESTFVLRTPEYGA